MISIFNNYTPWKGSKNGVFSGQYSLRIKENYGREKTPYLDTFHPVRRQLTLKYSNVVKHELRVTTWKFKSTSWNSKVRLEIQKCEFKSTSYEFISTSYEFKSTSWKTKSTSCKIKSTSWEVKSTSWEIKHLLGD